MKEIRFSRREGDYLILQDENGEQFRVELDSTIRQAIRLQTDTTSSFSPGEVQKLIRSGMSVQEVSGKLGADEESIEPFAAPVIAELNYIKAAALSVLVVAQDFDETVPFETLIRKKMNHADIRIMKNEGQWVVIAQNDSQSASFSFDPKTNWLRPLDEQAKNLLEDQHASATLTVIETPEVPIETGTPDASSVATDLLEELQRRRALKDQTPNESKPESSSKRPSLPSWDEIVFGAGESKNENEED
jgi:hypothetical protein